MKLINILLAAILVLMAGYALSPPPIHNHMKTGTGIMHDDQQKIVELITLADEAYFTFNEQDAMQKKMADLLLDNHLSSPPTLPPSEKDKPALIAINAPKIVDLGQRDDFPILLATHETGLHRWQVKDNLNLRVVIQDLDSGRVQSERLQTTPGKRMMAPKPSGSGTKPDAINAGSTTTSISRYFLRKLLDIDWRPSRLAVTVVFYDRVSNTVLIELKGDKDKPIATKPLEPSKFLKTALSEEGLRNTALSIPAQSTHNIPVRGKIKATIGSVATRRSTAQTGSKVLMASLLMVKIDDDHPLQIDLVVPAVVQETPGSAQSVAATFSFDVSAILTGQISPGTYQTYLIAGAQTIGPYSFVFKE